MGLPSVDANPFTRTTKVTRIVEAGKSAFGINTYMPDQSIYLLFRTQKLSSSKRHFSAHWLNSAENYLALRGERGPSANTLIGLFQKLWRQGRLLLAIRVGWSILWLPEASR